MPSQEGGDCRIGTLCSAEHLGKFGKATEAGIILADVPLLIGNLLEVLLLSACCLPTVASGKEQGEGHLRTEGKSRWPSSPELKEAGKGRPAASAPV